MNGKELLQRDIIVNKIVLALHVPLNLSNAIHIDRPSHGFAFHLGGQKTYYFENSKTIDIDPNTVIYMPKGSSYNVAGAKTGKSCFAINFDTEEELSCDPFLFRPKDITKMLGLFKTADKAWKTRQPGYMEKCLSCISEIISIMKSELSANYASVSQKELITPALKYISENYTTEMISVPALADLCSISEVYMRRIFTATMGKSPIAYINELRLERGRDLLLSGEYSVTDVSKECGFSNECYFSREFKKHFGASPSKFIKLS